MNIKINRKAFHKLNSVLLCLSILVMTFQFVFAEPESVAIGKFNVVDVNRISSISVYDVSTSNTAISLIPQRDYAIKLKLTTNGGTRKIKSAQVKMWYDEVDLPVRESNFNDIVNMDGSKSVLLTWTAEDNSVKLNSGEDGSWRLLSNNCIIPSKEQLTSPNIIDNEFVFRITVGKVAQMTEEKTVWKLAYQVIDESGTDFGYYSNDKKPGLDMEWYCEVEAPKNISWGNILPGIDYADENSNQQIRGVKYISNGKYNVQVKFDAKWKVENGSQNAILTENPQNSNEFALRVSNSDNLTLAKQIPIDGSYVKTEENCTPTTFQGLTRDNYNFYIKLNSNFDIGMYSGNITFGVSNGL